MNESKVLTPSAPTAWQSVLSGGFLLALVSGVAYTAVYVYDVTYCSYFQIPQSFISIAVPNLIAVAIITLMAFYFIIQITFLPIRYVRKIGRDWPVLSVVLFLVLASWHGVLASDSLLELRIDLVLLLVFLMAGLVFVVWCFFWKREHAIQRILAPINFLTAFMSEQTASNIIGALFVLLSVFAAAEVGGRTAAIDTAHFVTNERQPKVVLAIYGNIAVTAPYNPRLRTVSSTFTIYEVGKTLPPLTLTYTGMLRKTARPTSSPSPR